MAFSTPKLLPKCTRHAFQTKLVRRVNTLASPYIPVVHELSDVATSISMHTLPAEGACVQPRKGGLIMRRRP